MNQRQQQDTLDRWLSEFSGIFYKMVRVYAFNRHDQEDLFQEIVLQVWKSIPQYNALSKESTYVYQVALFAAMAWQKRETRQNRGGDTTEDPTVEALFHPAPVDDPRIDWLYEQLSKMSLLDRSLMLLALEGYSYREIASLLGLSESNTGSRLSRLKRKLADTHTEENVT